MKTLKTLFVAASTLIASVGMAQTADEVINKNITAMGGAAKISTLNTVKMEGSMNTQGIDVPLTITKKHLTGLRLDLEIMGTSNYQMANTTKGWVFMPIMQQTEPQEMTADQHKMVQSQFDVQGSLFKYKEKGYTVEYAGIEKVDGKDAHKLRVVKNGNTVYYFIDATSNFIVKTASKVSAEGQEMDVETKFADYKQNAEGYWFPYTNVTTQGTITFDKISANVPVDDKIFTN
jgi:hypothetical protein